MIDFHTHILPNFDDGSTSFEMSLEMLKRLKKQGVSTVCLSPHFYPSESSIEDYVARRNNCFKNFYKSIKETNEKIGLNLCLATEVAFYPGINHEQMRKLALLGTNYVLIELPYAKWDSYVYDSIRELLQMGIKPIMVHLERFSKYQDVFEAMEKFKSYGALIQCNTDLFLKFSEKLKAFRIVNSGYIDLLGSDCHNLTNRAPNYGMAIEKIKTYKQGEQILSHIKNNEKRIITPKLTIEI